MNNMYSALSNSELMLAEAEQKRIIQHVNSTGYFRSENVSREDRENALAELHLIRLEQMSRDIGTIGTPSEDDREGFERQIKRWTARLNSARSDDQVYNAKNVIQTYTDALVWLDNN